MKRFSLILPTLIILFTFCLFSVPPVNAQTASSSASEQELQKKIQELEEKLTSIKSEEKSLSSQISVMDNQISLTEYRIKLTEDQISDVTDDINSAEEKVTSLDKSASSITKTLLNRIAATYKIGTVQPVQFLLSSQNFNDFINQINYVRIVQANDKKLIYNTVQAKSDYTNQKDILEGKKQKVLSLQTQLEDYTTQLEQDKNAKEGLLKTTQNDEKKYQQLLAAARAEYMAIQGIVSGNGAETAVGRVEQGARVASIIPGASCNSSGAHLHFIVSKDGSTLSPFSYLKGTEINNCSGSSCGSGDGDSTSATGSWEWPISTPITMNQGYGVTWAVRNTWAGQIYSSHNGIDITSSSYEVRAVQSGDLYRGSYAGSGGCRLPYVRVRHDDGLDTFYLHVSY